MSSTNQYNGTDPETFNPRYFEGSPRPGHQDKATGGILVTDRLKDPAYDGVAAFGPEPTPATYVTVTSTSAIYVASTPIDCSQYSQLCILPNKLVVGDIVRYKVEWSQDGINWFSHPVYTIAASVGSERLQTIDALVIDIAAITGFKPLQTMFLQVQARFARILQKSTGAVSNTTQYHIQLLSL